MLAVININGVAVKNVIDILKERSFIEAMTSDELHSLANNPMKVYCGFDPSGDSLHLGNMVPIMGLAWFLRYGHTPVALIGGATGMIGDPSGKSSERQLLDEETIRRNSAGISEDLKKILTKQNSSVKPLFVNNYDWFKEFSFIDFLRDVGKYFRVGQMIAKDSVKSRLQSEEGMSFTEFSYQLLQGYDFYHLSKEYNVALQMGGSDQWGNITAGTEFIRKTSGKAAYGLTFPLLIKSDGQKFGKSEKGAIWLSKDKVSPYEFYQYLVRTNDADVIKLMRLLTFMDMDEVRHYESMMQKSDYVANTAQKKLAEEITKIVHGDEGFDVAIKVTKTAAPGSSGTLDAETLETLGKDMPSYAISLDELISAPVVDVLVRTGLQSSKGEAKKLLRNGGVYINNDKISDEKALIDESHLIDSRLLLIAVGKKNKMLIRILDKKDLLENKQDTKMSP